MPDRSPGARLVEPRSARAGDDEALRHVHRGGRAPSHGVRRHGARRRVEHRHAVAADDVRAFAVRDQRDAAPRGRTQADEARGDAAAGVDDRHLGTVGAHLVDDHAVSGREHALAGAGRPADLPAPGDRARLRVDDDQPAVLQQRADDAGEDDRFRGDPGRDPVRDPRLRGLADPEAGSPAAAAALGHPERKSLAVRAQHGPRVRLRGLDHRPRRSERVRVQARELHVDDPERLLRRGRTGEQRPRAGDGREEAHRGPS